MLKPTTRDKGEKMKERVYLMFLASFSHCMKPISHTPAGRCTSQSKHTRKWNVRTFRVTKTNCALGRSQSRAIVNQSAVQHSSCRGGQLSLSKWQQRFWKTKGNKRRTGREASRERKLWLLLGACNHHVCGTGKEKTRKGWGRVLPQEQAAPNQAGSTEMNGKQQCVMSHTKETRVPYLHSSRTFRAAGIS